MDPAIKLEDSLQNSVERAPPSLNQDLQLKLTLHEREDMLEADGTSARDRKDNPYLSPSQTTLENYLQKLSFRNHIRLNQLINWTAELIDFLTGKRLLSLQPFPGLIFQPITASKEPHYCYIKRLSTDYALLKLRQCGGQLISYKVVPNEQRIKEVSRLCNKLGLKGIMVVWDEYPSEEFLACNLKPTSYHLIYLNIHIEERNEYKEASYQMRKWKHLQMAYRHKVSTKIRIEDHISRLIEFQQQDLGLLATILTEARGQILYDRSFMLINLTRQQGLPSSVFSSTIVAILAQGANLLKNILLKIDLQKNKHFLCKGQSVERNSCLWCKKRKTDISCHGCQSIFDREINLCVGQCFMNYHLHLQQLARKDKRAEIGRDIKWMDDKCRQIDKNMESLLQIKEKSAEEGDQTILPDFMGYIGKKMMTYINRIAEQQLQRQTEVKEHTID